MKSVKLIIMAVFVFSVMVPGGSAMEENLIQNENTNAQLIENAKKYTIDMIQNIFNIESSDPVALSKVMKILCNFVSNAKIEKNAIVGGDSNDDYISDYMSIEENRLLIRYSDYQNLLRLLRDALNRSLGFKDIRSLIEEGKLVQNS